MDRFFESKPVVYMSKFFDMVECDICDQLYSDRYDRSGMYGTLLYLCKGDTA